MPGNIFCKHSRFVLQTKETDYGFNNAVGLLSFV